MAGLVAQHPAMLEKKVKLALRYKGYMADKLQAEAPSAQPETGTKVFLADFKRTSNAVLFRLSDGIIQVLSLQEIARFVADSRGLQMNFGDHSKLVLWDSAKAVRYVDKRGQIHVMALADAVSKGPKFEIIERLKVAANELMVWADMLSSEKRSRR